MAPGARGDPWPAGLFRALGGPGSPARPGEGDGPLPYAAIAAATVAVFAADLLTPLGIAVWVFYLLPILLSFLLWRPLAPLALAAVVTLFVGLGYPLSPPGVDPGVAAVNRGFGVTVLWGLAAAAHLFVKGKIAVRRQEWLQAAQVGLAERLAGEPGVDELAEGALRFLAERTGAQAGAAYVRNGAGFRLAAAHAPAPGLPPPPRLQPGEGLLGEAVRAGRAVLVDDLPAGGFLRVGSALGDAPPRFVLAAPAAPEGEEPNAAFELGFLGPPHEAALELLQRSAGALGVAFRSAEFRARLRELLEETQRQAEELQRQGEELRATNEELEEQSRALQASQATLERQQGDLEMANAELEGRARTLEEQRAELQRAGAALRERSAELERASRYKSEFLANMSHELRTPLNSSLILARLLADNRPGNLTGEQVRWAEAIEASGNDLLSLINDILDLSKIEAGHAEVHAERVEVAGLLARLGRAFAPVAEGKGVTLRVEAAEGAPGAVETDARRLEQILRNFLSNAIKFTDAGGEVTLEVDAAGEGGLAVSVRDTGIGVAPEQQEAIFEAFRQADGSTSRKYGGTGLGLSISRQLARLLGGRIALASAPGRGSTFTLVLPGAFDPAPAPLEAAAAGGAAPAGDAPAARRPPAEPPPRPRLAGTVPDDREALTGDSRVILVVEDDPAFARILADLARENGFQCLVAAGADEGVALARRHLPHAIVLDIGLPDHTGLSVLDRLKHNTRTRHIPVHVVSAHDYARDAMEQGAVGYVLKPTRREELAAALAGLERRLDRKVRRVLVVEDDAVQREAVRALLSAEGVETVGAPTGGECLERLARETFDCVVLDLALPDMTGFELLDRMGAEADARSFPPVVVYTGRELSADEELRLRRRSSSIVVKGARSPERLLGEVTLFLHQVVADLPGEQQRALARTLARDAAIEGRRILLVEDDVRNVFALTSVLEPHGAEVAIARNGREALDALEAAAEAGGEGWPDLVLMDAMMPEMDGLSAVRAIRARGGVADGARWRSLPILMLTAKAMPDDQRQCLDAGANDYMAKPLDVEKLLSLVRVWMPRR